MVTPPRSRVDLLAGLITVIASPAYAGSNTLGGYNIGPGSAYGDMGPRHSLTAVMGGGLGSTCVNALNDDGSGWAGSSYCAAPQDTTSHPYCGCKLRKGYLFPEYYEVIYAAGWQIW